MSTQKLLKRKFPDIIANTIVSYLPQEVYVEHEFVTNVEALDKYLDPRKDVTINILAMYDCDLNDFIDVSKKIKILFVECSGKTKNIKSIQFFKHVESFYWDEYREAHRALDLSFLKNMDLKKLYLERHRICKLEPLSLMKTLVDLDLRENDIRDIWPLAWLENLEILDLSYNFISDLWALSEMFNLKRLDLCWNRIKDLLALEKLVNLTHLSVEENKISKLDGLEGLINLTDLNFAQNRVATMEPISNLRNTIVYLKFSGNPIKE